MTEPQFFTITSTDSKSVVQACVRVFGEDGALLSLSEKALTRPYAPTCEWIPQRLPHEGEEINCHAWFENARKRWPDALSVGGAIQLVSRRVYKTFESEGLASYRVLPLEPAPRHSGLPKGMEMPAYVALLHNPGLEIEWEYLDVTPNRNPRLRLMNRRWKGWVPKEDVWKGFDLFRVEDGPACCTRRIIELARQHNWTNFEFKPLEVRRDMPTEGIDYLGKHWPPKSWYPLSPSEGKSVDEWVHSYMVQARKAYDHTRDPVFGGKPARRSAKAREREWKEQQRPRNAIVFDLAAESVPLFVDIACTGDERDQRIAADMILELAEHTRIDTGILKDIVLPIFARSLRQGGRGFGHSAMALNSYVEVPKDVLDLAHKATGKPPLIMPNEFR